MSSISAPRATKPIYQQDETSRSHLTKLSSLRRYADLTEEEQGLFKAISDATVLDDGKEGYVVETSETIFYAQGGGQPSDTGHMILGDVKFNVHQVRIGSEYRILHYGAFEGNPHAELFTSGDMVEQHVDAERRDNHSRLHTAGHILSLAVRRLAQQEKDLDVVDAKASHYPDACWVEFKGLIDGKWKEAIQKQTTEFVRQALPIKLYWYKPEELGGKAVITTEGMPVLTGPDGTVRVVDIVGAGAYPCGGTHVQDTSLVGKIVVRNIKRQKGMTKVSYAIAADE